MGSHSVICHPTQTSAPRLNPSQTGRYHGKFVAPGKFFPPPYCHNVTNANANPNPNPKYKHILNLNPNA